MNIPIIIHITRVYYAHTQIVNKTNNFNGLSNKTYLSATISSMRFLNKNEKQNCFIQ